MVVLAYHDDLMLAFARHVMGREQDEAETVEAVFAKARVAEAVAEEYLVDDGWKAPEPEVVEIHTNGARGNGHHADGLRSSVALLVGNSHAANGHGHTVAPVNGNSRHEEADEPQQSLFS